MKRHMKDILYMWAGVLVDMVVSPPHQQYNVVQIEEETTEE